MTWHLPLSVAQLRRAWRAFAFAAPLAGILLSVGMLALPSAPTGPRCTTLFSKAFGSPLQPVAGSFNCQAPMLRLDAAQAGYEGDAGLQRFAKENGWTGAAFVGGNSDSGWVYELGGPAPQLLIVWTDPSGLVTHFSIETRP